MKVRDDIANTLCHYGMKYRSGRYPWGSGGHSAQRSGDFISRINKLKKQGWNDSEIRKDLGVTTSEFRTLVSLAKTDRRYPLVQTAKTLKGDGKSLKEIADIMGYKNDSSVRALLDEDAEKRMLAAEHTASFLKDQVDKKGMIDVGAGVDRELNISKEMMKQALYILEMDGYPTYTRGMPQATNPGQQTIMQVLCKPGTQHKDIYETKNIKSIEEYVSRDGGKTFDTFQYPKSMDMNRVAVRYAEDGGIKKDGVVEIRRGVEDLSLGGSKYAQVRILVDNDKYIKGMAVYSDDIPEGVDLVFNTNKSKSVPKEKVFKPIDKTDPNNPFGSRIKANGQRTYTDNNGKEQLSLINKRSDEGDWDEWKDYLPSQFLAKQSQSLMKKQLKHTADQKEIEFQDIKKLNNPTVKKQLLETFANDCDSAAVHLKAAALPRQKYRVLLPVTSLKETEVYAPTYKHGEQVALVRFPHGGTFEIPIVTVNNRNNEAKKSINPQAIDAIGINSKVAERLSGADFDGDTVIVIPTKHTKVTSTPPLKGLEGFDPKVEYPYREGMRTMKNTQTQMGIVSNLITDMTLKGATQAELARAVRHSMVVIDAEKHKLDYKKSESDNMISALKQKYQAHVDEDGKERYGASTLLSRAKSDVRVPKTVGSPKVDPTTGEKVYKRTTKVYIDKQGNERMPMQSSTRMAETKDAFTLSSGTPKEAIYASYANTMKQMANKARLEIEATGKIEASPQAKKKYAKEVSRLTAALNVALKNAPKERRAQVLANSEIEAMKQANPDMKSGEIKKHSQQILDKYRIRVGAKKQLIKISDREWEAIQAGAISETKLKKILENTKIEDIKQRATPRESRVLDSTKRSKLRAMIAAGYTVEQMAEAVGVSPTTVADFIKE